MEILKIKAEEDSKIQNFGDAKYVFGGEYKNNSGAMAI